MARAGCPRDCRRDAGATNTKQRRARSLVPFFFGCRNYSGYELGSGCRRCRFGGVAVRFCVGLPGLLLVLLLAGRLHLHAALEDGAVLDADALHHHVAGNGTFAADVEAIAADDVALHLTHDHDFAGVDVGGNHAVAAHGHAMFGNIDGAFDAAINEERFRSTDVAFDDQRAADCRLLHGCARGLYRSVGIGIGRWYRILVFRWLQHVMRPSLIFARAPRRRSVIAVGLWHNRHAEYRTRTRNQAGYGSTCTLAGNPRF